MGIIREVSPAVPYNPEDEEYEDVDDDEQYTDNEDMTTSKQWGFMRPGWLAGNVGNWYGKLYSRMGQIFKAAGNIAWIFTTSLLLVGLPVLFAFDREKAIQEQQLMSMPSAK